MDHPSWNVFNARSGTLLDIVGDADSAEAALTSYVACRSEPGHCIGGLYIVAPSHGGGAKLLTWDTPPVPVVGAHPVNLDRLG